MMTQLKMAPEIAQGTFKLILNNLDIRQLLNCKCLIFFTKVKMSLCKASHFKSAVINDLSLLPFI